MKTLNLDEEGLIWGKWKINDSLWVLTNRWSNFCYLILGKEKGILFDTGYGEGNLREVVESITTLPIMVVLSHGHEDHAGGLFWWNECYCMESAKEEYMEVAPQWMKEELLSKLPENFRWNTVKEGHVFELGGHQVEVIGLTAHAKSGLALLDRENRLLFPGDEIDTGQVLLFCQNNLSAREMITLQMKDMEKLLKMEDQFDAIYPAHNGTAISKDYIRDFWTLDKMVLEGKAVIKDSVAGFGWAPEAGKHEELIPYYPANRAEYGLASILWRGNANE